VRKRTQLRTKAMGESTWTKRDKSTGKFMDQKKAPAKKKGYSDYRVELLCRVLKMRQRNNRRRLQPCERPPTTSAGTCTPDERGVGRCL